MDGRLAFPPSLRRVRRFLCQRPSPRLRLCTGVWTSFTWSQIECRSPINITNSLSQIISLFSAHVFDLRLCVSVCCLCDCQELVGFSLRCHPDELQAAHESNIRHPSTFLQEVIFFQSGLAAFSHFRGDWRHENASPRLIVVFPPAQISKLVTTFTSEN